MVRRRRSAPRTVRGGSFDGSAGRHILWVPAGSRIVLFRASERATGGAPPGRAAGSREAAPDGIAAARGVAAAARADRGTTRRAPTRSNVNPTAGETIRRPTRPKRRPRYATCARPRQRKRRRRDSARGGCVARGEPNKCAGEAAAPSQRSQSAELMRHPTISVLSLTRRDVVLGAVRAAPAQGRLKRART